MTLFDDQTIDSLAQTFEKTGVTQTADARVGALGGLQLGPIEAQALISQACAYHACRAKYSSRTCCAVSRIESSAIKEARAQDEPILGAKALLRERGLL